MCPPTKKTTHNTQKRRVKHKRSQVARARTRAIVPPCMVFVGALCDPLCNQLHDVNSSI